MNRANTVKLLGGAATVGAGALWFNRTSARFNEGGFRVENGQVIPVTAGGDRNTIIDLQGRSHQVGTYAAAEAAYDYAQRYVSLIARNLEAVTAALPPETAQDLYQDFVNRGAREYRVEEFCTPDQTQWFVQLLRSALGFGLALRLLGYATIATGQLTTFTPPKWHRRGQSAKLIRYGGEFNPMGGHPWTSTRNDIWVECETARDWVIEGQRVEQSWLRAYASLVPLSGADVSNLAEEFREEIARTQEAEMSGTMGVGAAAAAFWGSRVVQWGVTIAIVVLAGATAYALYLGFRDLSVYLFGEAALADELTDRLEELAECVANEDLSEQVRAGCERSYAQTLADIHSIEPAAPDLMKWGGIAIISAAGVAGVYFGVKALRKK